LAELRAPIYEEKVVDHILGLAKVEEQKVTREELLKPVDDELSSGSQGYMSAARAQLGAASSFPDALGRLCELAPTVGRRLFPVNEGL
jgi:trigger factor